MRVFKFSVFVFLWLSTSFAQNEVEVPENSVLFSDPVSDRILVFSPNKEFFVLEKGALVSLGSIEIPQEECSLENLKSMNYASSYFVGVGSICFLDEIKKTILLLVKEEPPVNAMGAMYLGENAEWVYFIVNGRPWDSLGYLKLRIIHKKTKATYLKDFIHEVPGYSGAMAMDGKNFYVTLWDEAIQASQMHQLKSEALLKTLELHALEDKNGSLELLSFKDVSEKRYSSFEYLSLQLAISKKGDFLYFNKDYESFTIQGATGEIALMDIPEDCDLIGPSEKKWWFLCGQNKLVELWSD